MNRKSEGHFRRGPDAKSQEIIMDTVTSRASILAMSLVVLYLEAGKQKFSTEGHYSDYSDLDKSRRKQKLGHIMLLMLTM
jgi:hypothetical protein